MKILNKKKQEYQKKDEKEKEKEAVELNKQNWLQNLNKIEEVDE